MYRWYITLLVFGGADIAFTAWGLSQGGAELNPLAVMLWVGYGVAGLVIAKALAIILTLGVGLYLKTPIPVIVGVCFQAVGLLVPLLSFSL